ALPAEVHVAATVNLKLAARRLAPARDAEVALEALADLRRHQRLLRVEHAAAQRALGAQLERARAELTPAALDEVAALFVAAAAELTASEGEEAAADGDTPALPDVIDRAVERRLR